MVILGLLLIGLGVLAIVAALFASDGTGQLLGIDLPVLTIFVIGVGAGAAVLWGWSILKYGTKRGLEQRRERKQLNQMSKKLDQLQADRQPDAGRQPDAE